MLFYLSFMPLVHLFNVPFCTSKTDVVEQDEPAFLGYSSYPRFNHAFLFGERLSIWSRTCIPSEAPRAHIPQTVLLRTLVHISSDRELPNPLCQPNFMPKTQKFEKGTFLFSVDVCMLDKEDKGKRGQGYICDVVFLIWKFSETQRPNNTGSYCAAPLHVPLPSQVIFHFR